MSIVPVVAIFILAASVRIGYAAACYLYLGPDGLMGPDSYAFLKTAQFLADGGSVMQVASEGLPGMDINVMPVAFILMGWTLLKGVAPDPLNYVLLQALMDAGTCILIGYIAQHIKKEMFIPAALLAALNPTQVVVAGMVYADTPFLFFIVAGFALCIGWLKEPSFRFALGMGVAWGLALMTRPFIQYWLYLLPAFLLILSLIMHRSGSVRRIIHVTVMMVLVVAIAAPMILRNLERYDTVKLSAQSGAHLLYWVTPLVREFKDGTPRAQSNARSTRLYENWNGTPPPDNPFLSSDRMLAVAKQELWDIGPAAIASAWAKGIVMNLLAPASTIATPVSSMPRTGFYDTPGANFEDKVWNYLFNNEGATYAAILLASGATMPFWVVLGIAGIFIGLYRQPKAALPVLLLVLWAGFTLMLNGPVVSPKYRLPMEPAWMIFTAISLGSLWHKITARKKYLSRD